MTTEKLQDENISTTCHIYSDSQAAINVINNPRRQSGQAIIKDFLEHIDDVIITKSHTWISKALKHLTKQKGVRMGPKLYNSLSNRNTIATIIQLRTGHRRLSKYLYSIGARYSPYCECGYGKETMEHYLLERNKYKNQRKQMRLELKKGRMTVGRLLGNPQAIKHTMKYIKETARLERGFWKSLARSRQVPSMFRQFYPKAYWEKSL
jgi:hypothetical protein